MVSPRAYAPSALMAATALVLATGTVAAEGVSITGSWTTEGESLVLLANGFFRAEWAPEYEWEDPTVNHGRYSYSSGTLRLDFFDGGGQEYAIGGLTERGFTMTSSGGDAWKYSRAGDGKLSAAHQGALVAHLNRANLMGTAWQTSETQTIFFLEPDYAIITDTRWREDQLIDGRVVTEGDELYLMDYSLSEVQHRWRIAQFGPEVIDLVDAEGAATRWTRTHKAKLNPTLMQLYGTYVSLIHNINQQAAYGIGQALGDVIVIWEDE